MLQFLDKAFAGHIDDDDKIKAHALPNPLDVFAYANGVFIDVSDIKLKKGWKIDPNWNPNDGKSVRPNYVNVPMLISESPGSTLQLTFEGNAVGIAVAAGPDAGIIGYRIDRGKWQRLNLFTPWRLELKITDEKDEQSNGHACRIRYIYVNKP